MTVLSIFCAYGGLLLIALGQAVQRRRLAPALTIRPNVVRSARFAGGLALLASIVSAVEQLGPSFGVLQAFVYFVPTAFAVAVTLALKPGWLVRQLLRFQTGE